jgi:DNA-binding response OmpR family regulator
MKILVVEDEQELLDSVCTYLTREGQDYLKTIYGVGNKFTDH